MQIAWGRQQTELDLPEHNLITPRRSVVSDALTDPVQAMRDALEHPIDYPALRRGLTPDDHIAVVLDERIPQLVPLLVVLFEHLGRAGIPPEAITLICLPPSSGQAWLDELPDEFQDVRIEVHQPGDRKKLAYLATTKEGRRVYLNRSAVDADQLVLLTRRGYDPILGFSGAETTFFPGLSDDATIVELCHQPHHHAPDLAPWPIQQEARQIAWLLGAPFFIQVIEGLGDAIQRIIAGPLESGHAGEALLNESWRVLLDHPVDVVIATVTGDPGRQTIDDLARAFFAASRVVRPGGSVALLSEANPTLGRSFAIFRQHDDPNLALHMLMQEKAADLAAGYMWTSAANHARLYLLSGLSGETAEEMFTIPMQNAGQVRNLLGNQATWLLLPDAHKTLAVVR